VFPGGAMAKIATSPADRADPHGHLLTHTSGLTYGFHHHGAVDELYRAAGFEWGSPPASTSPAAARVGRAAAAVRARHGVELRALDRRARARDRGHLRPAARRVPRRPRARAAGMAETGFHAPEADHGRLAALYVPIPRPVCQPAAPPPRPRSARPRTSPAAAGSSRPPATTRASRACCAAAASSTACACSARARCG
jgi:CubicO group peptidase (beta-lactamase class C family)